MSARKVKSVEWSYPTSPNAEKLGYTETGCWTVEIGTAGEPLTPIEGYHSKQRAIEHADKLDGFEWLFGQDRYHSEIFNAGTDL